MRTCASSTRAVNRTVRRTKSPPSGAEQYAAGHIAGAVHLDYADHLKDGATPYAMRVAPPEHFAAVLGANGIGDHTLVLAYDDGDVPYAARLIWMLGYYGHDAARILSGGYKGWLANGGASTTHVPTYAPALFTPRLRRSCARRAPTYWPLPKAVATRNCWKRNATKRMLCAISTSRAPSAYPATTCSMTQTAAASCRANVSMHSSTNGDSIVRSARS